MNTGFVLCDEDQVSKSLRVHSCDIWAYKLSSLKTVGNMTQELMRCLVGFYSMINFEDGRLVFGPESTHPIGDELSRQISLSAQYSRYGLGAGVYDVFVYVSTHLFSTNTPCQRNDPRSFRKHWDSSADSHSLLSTKRT